MSDESREKAIEKAIKENINDKGIECEVAQEIAADLGVEPKEVGKVAKNLGLDLKNCQGAC
ncbi:MULTISPECIES: hypothetical protein [unclassified Candidatus Frackibacter]|uniref:hypothetical protein n=1 Tax=unclassified Candidatus Frackibacter TaxID=2648818 RepID=UPI000B7CFAFC|nr:MULTISPECIES: hypothetical protein [unclassified Candidatus Frackibacter]